MLPMPFMQHGSCRVLALASINFTLFSRHYPAIGADTYMRNKTAVYIHTRIVMAVSGRCDGKWNVSNAGQSPSRTPTTTTTTAITSSTTCWWRLRVCTWILIKLHNQNIHHFERIRNLQCVIKCMRHGMGYVSLWHTSNVRTYKSYRSAFAAMHERATNHHHHRHGQGGTNQLHSFTIKLMWNFKNIFPCVDVGKIIIIERPPGECERPFNSCAVWAAPPCLI